MGATCRPKHTHGVMPNLPPGGLWGWFWGLGGWGARVGIWLNAVTGCGAMDGAVEKYVPLCWAVGT